MAIRTVYLIRHGEYHWDTDHARFLHLTPRGEKQARLTAKRIASIPVTAFYSSDLVRAVETAEIIRRHLPGSTLVKRRMLREVLPPSPWLKNVVPERTDAGRKRAELAFVRLFRKARGGDKHEVVVCHGNLIRWLVTRGIGGSGEEWLRMDTRNCGISEVVVSADGTIKVVSYNDVGHLPPSLTTKGTPPQPPAV